jgi:hypothetical protein
VRAPAGRAACAAGCALEPEPLLAARRMLAGAPPRPGDLWLDIDRSSCGLVTSVRPDPERGLAIAIRHLRSRPARVCVEDFYFQLHGRGSFFR